MWKIPKQVVTPDLENDIERLLSSEILRLYKQSDDGEKKARIQRITEMLDFLDHLLNFKEFLVSINKPRKRVKDDKIFIDDDIRFKGHDY